MTGTFKAVPKLPKKKEKSFILGAPRGKGKDEKSRTTELLEGEASIEIVLF